MMSQRGERGRESISEWLIDSRFLDFRKTEPNNAARFVADFRPIAHARESRQRNDDFLQSSQVTSQSPIPLTPARFVVSLPTLPKTADPHPQSRNETASPAAKIKSVRNR